MKRHRFFLAYFAAYALIPTSLFCASTHFSFRSQSVHAERHFSGINTELFRAPTSNAYATYLLTIGYGQTFDGSIVVENFFNPYLQCQGNTAGLVISGSSVPNRGAQDLFADYFYLPRDFKSFISFKPEIKNLLFEWSLYAGLDSWYPGMYFMFDAPFVHTRWTMNPHEKVLQRGVLSDPPGYLATREVFRSELFNTMSEYFNGNQISSIEDTFEALLPTPSTQKFNVILESLRSAKIAYGDRTRSRFADLRARLGINFLWADDYHLGLNIQTAAPTGNRPSGEYLFEPVAGNGHHWELGMGLNGHYSYWYSEDESTELQLGIDINVTHLFDSAQRRTLDLVGKPLSRYMLAEQIVGPLTLPLSLNLKAGGVTPSAQFTSYFAPVANLTNTKVNVSVAAQVDAVFALTALHKNWTSNLGCDIWYRSAEIFHLRDITFIEQHANEWALKGDARVFGFASANDAVSPELTLNQPVALSATQSDATVTKGLNGSSTVNSNIDDPFLATAGGSNTALNNEPGGVQINTSRNPAFIRQIDIDLCNGEPAALSTTVFGHIHYTWNEYKRWIPSVGFGSEIEFNLSKLCGPCGDRRVALSQWNTWFKAGLAFD